MKIQYLVFCKTILSEEYLLDDTLIPISLNKMLTQIDIKIVIKKHVRDACIISWAPC